MRSVPIVVRARRPILNAPARAAATVALALVLLLSPGAGTLAAEPPGSALRVGPPFLLLGRALGDGELLTALRDASLAESVDLVLGAAAAVADTVAAGDGGAVSRYDRPRLIRGLLEELPHQSAYVRHLLAALYLERAYFNSAGEPRSPAVPENTLAYLDSHLTGAGEPGRPDDWAHPGDVSLAAVYFRLAAAYRRAPSAAALMQTGSALLGQLERTSGRLDASWTRLAFGYLESALLRPDPTLAVVIDDIRRASRDGDLVTRAATVSRRLFD